MRNAIKTIGIALAFMAGIVPSARAQTATLAPMSYQTLEDANGDPISGGCVWTYTAGTTTPATTYTSKTISVGTQNTNPIQADGSGQFVVYLVPGQSYKFTYEDNDCALVPPTHGTVLRTRDNIDAVPASAASLDLTGTAGEALAAGDCAYLSDGSGAKTAGRWYKCDSANTYSSTTPEVGMVPTAISSAATGTIRIGGYETGLTALTVGAEYYVGTSGAITTTAPSNKRHLGHADTTTALVFTGNPSTPQLSGVFDDFRISPTTLTCVPSADVTGASAVTLFLVPCSGNRITLFSSAGLAETCISGEINIAVPATTSTMYDLWAYDSSFGSCTTTLEALAWTNDTTRATAVVRTTTGALTKSGDLTRRYLGSFRTTTVSGQTEDSIAKRYIWNFYNRASRAMRVIETTNTWTYNGVFRQANGAPANQLDFVVGVQDSTIEGYVVGDASGNGTATNMIVAIGEDSTTTPDAACLTGTMYTLNIGAPFGVQAQLGKQTAVGRHTWVWLEKAGAATTTWYGDNGSDGTQAGIHGTIWN